VSDLSAKRDLHRGFSDALVRAVEIVVTPGIFAGFGYLLDRAFGTAPVLVLVLFFLGLAGVAVKLYYGYSAEMARHDEGAPWAPAARARGRQR
jgi:F0F1-type ATP synthase assembly protein I